MHLRSRVFQLSYARAWTARQQLTPASRLHAAATRTASLVLRHAATLAALLFPPCSCCCCRAPAPSADVAAAAPALRQVQLPSSGSSCTRAKLMVLCCSYMLNAAQLAALHCAVACRALLLRCRCALRCCAAAAALLLLPQRLLLPRRLQLQCCWQLLLLAAAAAKAAASAAAAGRQGFLLVMLWMLRIWQTTYITEHTQ